MSRTLARVAVTAVSTAAVSMVALAPSPALAGSMFFSKSSGTFASVGWIEMGTLPGVAAGNAHIGSLTVEKTSRDSGNAFGVVFDLTCPEGAPVQLPGGGHGEFGPAPEPKGPACVLESVREVEGRGLSFSINRTFTSARLSGTLTVGEHGAPTNPTTPPVSITWNGVGELFKDTNSGRYSNESGTGSFRYSFTGRSAEIAEGSRIGGMVFDDEEGESSSASMGAYRSVSRDRT